MAINPNHSRQGGYQRQGGFPGGGGGGRDGGGRAASVAVDPELVSVLKRINLAAPHPAMFDNDAQQIADLLRLQAGKNKSSQIRRFYDELLRYRAQVRDDAALIRALPFIRMLNARAAYAVSRDLVDVNFREFLRTLLEQVKDTTTLRNACTTFEAVIGFSPK